MENLLMFWVSAKNFSGNYTPFFLLRHYFALFLLSGLENKRLLGLMIVNIDKICLLVLWGGSKAVLLGPSRRPPRHGRAKGKKGPKALKAACRQALYC